MQNRGSTFGWSEWTGTVAQNVAWGPYQYKLIHANSAFGTK
jgi:hypothetical protein